MSESSKGTNLRDCELEYLERNNYFTGKLLTPRDMRDEQSYHTDRAKLVARDVLGSGVIRGLSVSLEPGAEGNDVRVFITRGAALDCCGNLVVVEESDRVDVSPSGTGDQYLYLRYDECKRETVPVPNGGDACEGECDYNRILEKFEVVAVPVGSDPHGGPHTVSTVSFPRRSALLDANGDPEPDPEPHDRELMRIAHEYYETHRSEYDSCTDAHVYLCRITEGENGEWEIGGGDEGRGEYVYSSELLYAAIARHTAAFDNPHDTSLTVTEPDGALTVTEPNPADAGRGAFLHVEYDDENKPDVRLLSPEDHVDFTVSENDTSVTLTVPKLAEIDENREDIDTNTNDITTNRNNITTNRDNITALTRKVSLLERYVLDKTLKYKLACFGQVADRFRGTLAGQVADAIVERTWEGIDRQVYRPDDADEDRPFHAFTEFFAERADETFDEGIASLRESGELITVTTLDDHQITIDRSQYEGATFSITETALSVDPTLFELELLLGDALESLAESAHEPTYEEALDELRAELDRDESALDVAVAQDLVCETASWFEGEIESPVVTGDPATVFLGDEDLNLTGVAGVPASGPFTFTGLSSDAEGTLADVDDVEHADISAANDFQRGGYDTDSDETAELIVEEPSVSTVVLLLEDGSDVTNGSVSGAETLEVTAKWNFHEYEDVVVSVESGDGLDVTDGLEGSDGLVIEETGGSITLTNIDSLNEGRYTVTVEGEEHLDSASRSVTFELIETGSSSRIETVSGIGTVRSERLRNAGITSLVHLVAANPERVAVVAGVSPETAREWIERAREILRG